MAGQFRRKFSLLRTCLPFWSQKLINASMQRRRTASVFANGLASKKPATSIKALASRVGVDHMVMSRHMEEEGFPAKGAEGWDVVAVREWLVERGHIKSEAATMEEAALKEQKLKNEIKLQEIKIAEAKGEVIRLSEAVGAFQSWAAQVIGFTRAKLENELPAHWAGMEPDELRAEGRKLCDSLIDFTRASLEKLDPEAEFNAPEVPQA